MLRYLKRAEKSFNKKKITGMWYKRERERERERGIGRQVFIRWIANRVDATTIPRFFGRMERVSGCFVTSCGAASKSTAPGLANLAPGLMKSEAKEFSTSN